ncbi:DinB family protein [bacterium]|nr:DinB family protein [bacterium]MBU1983210.1 DinB family protein [bacterium]
MIVLDDLKRHFRYNTWANETVLKSLPSARIPPKALRWMNHIAACEYLWIARILQHGQPFAVWPEWSYEECRRQILSLAETWPAFLSSLTSEGLSRKVSYVNVKGEHFTNTVGDILTHVLYHSAHHRGQATADIRACGGEPVSSDFIHAVRSHVIE